ncbi:CBO0543 family protein [Bacillus alveayuensis]|uniref:CBO0543 family protein n=1 Tax=Aeribacillus alveayuensis TaxID=279215 RepID=UPI00069724E5
MKTIVKHSKKLNLPLLPKKQFFLGKNNVALIATVLLASLLGTYLDLLLVHSGFYTFPKRLFPKLFSINILFTLVILPIITTSFLMVMSKIHPFVRPLLLLIIGIFAYLFELMAERIGLFIHAPKWNHLNSFIGYILFFMMMWRFYSLLVNSTKNK